MPYFRAYDKIEQSREASTIRINSLSVIEESFVNSTAPLPVSTPSLVADNDQTGQSLELDQAHSLQVKMYGDRAFLDEQYLFDPSEKMFLVMEFNQLKAGEHNLLALWKSPNGQLVNSSRHSISLTRQSPKHRSYFWLKLIRNGLFTEMLTGNDYKGDIHGRWDAEIYLDGARITIQHFMIHN